MKKLFLTFFAVSLIAAGCNPFVGENLITPQKANNQESSLDQSKTTRQTEVYKNDSSSKQDQLTGKIEFAKENDNWVLYGKNREKLGLILSVEKQSYYDPYPILKYRDFPYPIKYRVSPDEKKIIYLYSPTELEQNLYIADVGGFKKEVLAKPLGAYGHGAIENFYWTPDGKSVIYEDVIGDEGGSSSVTYKFNVAEKSKTILKKSGYQELK